MLRGRPCLVAGGGRTAAHKARLLMDGGADVTVVSPHAEADILQEASNGRLRLLTRAFAEADLDGVFLAFAATSDPAVNGRIVERCRERGILCGAGDGNWTNGDLVTPAVFREDDLTVAVSTGGKSCRRSRMIRDSLSRDVQLMRTADLMVMGISHQQLPLAQREPLHLVGQRLEQAGRMLAQVRGVHEFTLLNTCNRVELQAVVSRRAELVPLLARILGFDRLAPGQYYVQHGYEAFAHVAMLTAGLLSQTPGENHIVAQVKESLDKSIAEHWAGNAMREWISGALHVSKDIRTVAAPMLRAFDIEDVCLAYVRGTHPQAYSGGILVLGTGTIGMGVVRRLTRQGCPVDVCYHLRRPELDGAAKEYARLFTFDDLRERLAEARLVICATDSPHFVLMSDHAPHFRTDAPVLLVDLTMPRNIDPALGSLQANLRIVDLEDLKHWFRRELADLDRILDLSHQTVGEHAGLYEKLILRFDGR